MKQAKRAVPDGYQISETVVAYDGAVGSSWRSVKAFLVARYAIILSATDGFDSNEIKFAIKGIAQWVSSALSKVKDKVPLQPCDVLLYHSSRKPSLQPAIDNLAARLASAGYRSVVLSPGQMSTWTSEGLNQPITGYEGFLRRELSRWQSVKLLCVSLLQTAFLAALFLFRKPALLKLIFYNPFRIWYELLLGSHRLEIASRMLRQLKPRLIITNGEHLPEAAALLLSNEAEGAFKVWFFNEYPTPDMLPVISDQVWVWNQDVIDSFHEILPKGSPVKFSITGKPEIDFAFDAAGCGAADELELHKETQSKKVLVFLSEFTGSKVLRMEELTIEAVRWLAQAARHCPDWIFIYKSRPLHHDRALPGVELISGLSNCTIPKAEINLSCYLNWPNVRAVAACSSSGLFVAAGLGKPALRLMVSSMSTPHPVIDNIAIAIHSPEDLIQVLAKLPDKAESADMNDLANRSFPYRGRTLDRMESLCLERLRG